MVPFLHILQCSQFNCRQDTDSSCFQVKSSHFQVKHFLRCHNEFHIVDSLLRYYHNVII